MMSQWKVQQMITGIDWKYRDIPEGTWVPVIKIRKVVYKRKSNNVKKI